jgi:large subunit ribosomal protein L4
MIRGALRAALTQKFKDSEVLVVDQLAVDEPRTRHAAELLGRLDAGGKTLLVDVSPDSNLSLAVRNITGVRMSSTSQLGARDVVDAGRVVLTRAAIERLEQVLAS